MRKALIETATGLVVNVIEWEQGTTWQPPPGHFILDAQNASPGDIWDGTQFIPAPPTPEAIAAEKRRQAQAKAVQAIKDNAGASPWGKILNDIAIAIGWIEPQ